MSETNATTAPAATNAPDWKTTQTAVSHGSIAVITARSPGGLGQGSNRPGPPLRQYPQSVA